MYPEDLKYSSQHEWVQTTDHADGVVRVGITDFAQEQLGDIVYVSLPEIGQAITQGESCGELESTKAVNDIFAPISGTIVARNEALDEAPELVNTSPYAEGWLFEVTPDSPDDLDELMTSDKYAEFVS